MSFDQNEAFTCGRYNPATDTLVLYPLALAGKDTGERTLTHEIGHRFYFKELPGQARAYWNEVLGQRGLKITSDDIHRFSQAVIQQMDDKDPSKMFYEDNVLKAALTSARDMSDEVKFKEMAKTPVKPWNVDAFSPEGYLKLLGSLEGNVVQIEEITKYGNTNPQEAFAECFQLWVLKGPRALGPWTRDFFTTVCRAGGAKLASRLIP